MYMVEYGMYMEYGMFMYCKVVGLYMYMQETLVKLVL